MDTIPDAANGSDGTVELHRQMAIRV